MARARNIKPGFFANEDLAECSPWARLCFAGLWTLADREGRLEDRPKRIKGELFRFDPIEVEPLLLELERFKFILRYEVDGNRYISIPEFKTHQTPHYSEKESVIKPPPLQEKSGIKRKESESPPGSGASSRGVRNPLNPDSLNPDSPNHESLLPSVEGCGPALRAAPPTPPPDFDGKNAEVLNGKAVVAIAPGFELPDQWGFDAEALGFKPPEVLRQAQKFRQYWTAGKGSGTRRSVKGWRQTWSNWLDKAAKDAR